MSVERWLNLPKSQLKAQKKTTDPDPPCVAGWSVPRDAQDRVYNKFGLADPQFPSLAKSMGQDKSNKLSPSPSSFGVNLGIKKKSGFCPESLGSGLASPHPTAGTSNVAREESHGEHVGLQPGRIRRIRQTTAPQWPLAGELVGSFPGREVQGMTKPKWENLSPCGNISPNFGFGWYVWGSHGNPGDEQTPGCF